VELKPASGVKGIAMDEKTMARIQQAHEELMKGKRRDARSAGTSELLV
jgi:hypothetical protein